ncbi:unnamed protein product [Pylaiella littoralis]
MAPWPTRQLIAARVPAAEEEDEEDEEHVAPVAPSAAAAPLAPVAPAPRSRVQLAMLAGDEAMFQALLAHGADPNLLDGSGFAPLHMAASEGCTWKTALLLGGGANTRALSHDGHSPLHLAAIFNRAGVAELLLSAPVSSLELRDRQHDMTPLSWASRVPQTDVLRVLLEGEADVNSTSPAGSTPLHMACLFVAADNVDLLLRAGADPSAVDETGADAESLIGLGDTRNSPGARTAPILGQVVHHQLEPSDSESAERIRSGLKRAKAWRRRGWLMVLVKQRASVVKPDASPKRLAQTNVPDSSSLLASPARCVAGTQRKGVQCLSPGPGMIDFLYRLRDAEEGLFRRVVGFT